MRQLEYEPMSPRWRDDPYPVYRELRERAPVYRTPETGVWCVSRHEDVGFVLRNPDVFSSHAMSSVLMNADMGPLRPRYVWALARFLWKTRISPFRMQRAGNLVSMDPPRHDAMRNIVNRGFTPRRIASWEPRIREIVSQRTEKLRRREPFDVVSDLAVPLPVTIIAEMLGVEPERRSDFKQWSDAIVQVASSSARANPVESGLLESFGELYAYLRSTLRERRRAPREDLISVLVDPSRDAVLDELDTIQFVVLLLVAGNETTTNWIGNAALALLDHPDQLERVCAEPELVPSLAEETLRWDPPVQMAFRNTTRAVEVAGTRIPEGAVVVPLIGSANRDERVFPEPDRFDVCRDVRGQLAFGLGVHFCLGASLARLEARIALEQLVPELPGRKRTGPTPELIDSFLVRGRTRLELTPA